MIYLLYGDNDFARRQRRAALIDQRPVSYYDADTVTPQTLREVVTGQPLFGGDRVLVLTDMSSQPAIWQQLPTLLAAATSPIILQETKLDKRTKTYKWLVGHATVYSLDSYGPRQRSQLVAWCQSQATQYGYQLQPSQAGWLIDRLGYDQSRLDMIIGQLALTDEVDDQRADVAVVVSDELLHTMVPLPKTESAFVLCEALLDGRLADIHQTIRYLEQEQGRDGAYQTMGLLASQLVQLVGLVFSGGDTAAVAADLQTHTYALRRLVPFAKQLSPAQLAPVSRAFREADLQMRTTSINPWLALEVALQTAATALHPVATTYSKTPSHR